jgi:hypothetical protein
MRKSQPRRVEELHTHVHTSRGDYRQVSAAPREQDVAVLRIFDAGALTDSHEGMRRLEIVVVE